MLVGRGVHCASFDIKVITPRLDAGGQIFEKLKKKVKKRPNFGFKPHVRLEYIKKRKNAAVKF